MRRSIFTGNSVRREPKRDGERDANKVRKYLYKLKRNFPRPETFPVRYYGRSANKTNHTL